jgi:hypothetical protein
MEHKSIQFEVISRQSNPLMAASLLGAPIFRSLLDWIHFARVISLQAALNEAELTS